jgi:citrate lyase beta subunit
MKVSLQESQTEKLFNKLRDANVAFNKYYPGDSAARQPVHTVYGGAHLFKADSAKKLGVVALKALEENAPNFVVFAKALQLPGWEELPEKQEQITILSPLLNESPQSVRAEASPSWLAYNVYHRVQEKLKREAVEDFRIDFEDGYGNRPDAEEDGHAEAAAIEVAKALKEKILPPFIGIRVKPFNEELKHRSARTLDIFVTTLVAETKGQLPDNFVITIPKVTIPEQVTCVVELFKLLEAKTGLRPGSLKLELMIEQTQTIVDRKGVCTMPLLVEAADGRCVAAHFGVYDYTASCNITASQQRLDHPSCDFARHMMKVALAGTGIWLSDGATNVMPVGPHRAEKDAVLSEIQKFENQEVVHRAWKLGYDHTRHSLMHAFYQGWDLHPAQLPIRYAACYAFFLEGLDAASTRLKAFIEKAAQATLVGDVFDDAATGQGLLNYFLRAINCGAITEQEVEATGLTLDEIRTRSFLKILDGRRKKLAGRK